MANEIRLRSNNISGAINNNPLTIGATTINSPGFADLPVVNTTNHLILTLDPLEVYGAAEVVTVTAHTASATSLTVLRGQESSIARQHPLGTTWFHGPVASDFAPTPVPTCRLGLTANQSITDNTETVVAWTSELFDPSVMHDNAVTNSRITVPLTGVYSFTFNGYFPNLTTYSQAYSFYRINGVTTISYAGVTPTTFNQGPLLTHALIYKMTAGDFMELFVYQDNTANTAQNLQGGAVAGTAGWSCVYVAAG